MGRVASWLARFSLALAVVACGGGGGETPAQPPSANPGSAQSVMVGETAVLDGRASSDPQGGSLTFSWRLVSRPSGSTATLADASSAQPTLTPDVVGDYTLSLVVDNGSASSMEASMVVSATPDIRSQASAARLAAIVRYEDRTVELSWTDGMADGTVFHIEAVDEAGNGTTLKTLEGAGGGATVRSELALDGLRTVRVRAFYAGSRAALKTSGGATTLAVAAPAVVPSIAVDKPEPLIDRVTVSIANAGSYGLVTWYLDLAPLGTATVAPDYSVSWDAARATDGPHLLLARIDASPGVQIELRRQVAVSNSTIVLTAGISYFQRDRIWLVARATSDVGIRSAEATLDGRSLGVLTSYNLTTPWGVCCSPDAFGWQVENLGLVSGTYAWRITVTDNSGASRSSAGTVTINNPPVLVLDSPPDGGVVRGSLTISGSYTYDKPLAVTVVATLGAVEVLRTSSSPFVGTFSLAGVVPGNYVLKVRAFDVNGTETVIERTVAVSL